MLVENLTNAWPKTEKATFNAVASLGTDTVKNVLLYHLLGAKVGVATVLVSNGVRVPTLLAGTNFKINIRGGVVKLIDNDPNAKNPAVAVRDPTAFVCDSSRTRSDECGRPGWCPCPRSTGGIASVGSRRNSRAVVIWAMTSPP